MEDKIKINSEMGLGLIALFYIFVTASELIVFGPVLAWIGIKDNSFTVNPIIYSIFMSILIIFLFIPSVKDLIKYLSMSVLNKKINIWIITSVDILVICSIIYIIKQSFPRIEIFTVWIAGFIKLAAFLTMCLLLSVKQNKIK